MLRIKWIFIAIIICSASQLIYAQQFEMLWDCAVRTYVVYEPNDLDPENPESLPLIVVLHGEGDDANGIIDYINLALKSDEEQFIVVSPNALIYDETSLWNAGGGYEAMTDSSDDVGFISTLID
jgi:poly(3-hydroxybutyrate) depolymerase